MTDSIRPLGEARKHFWLTTAMARAVGVDLSAAMHQGLLNHADYSDMVTRCRKCEFASECGPMLDQQWGDPIDAPPQCENRNTWDWLVCAQRG